MGLLRFPGRGSKGRVEKDGGPGEAEIRRLVRLALDEAPATGDHPGEYAFASYLEGTLAEGAEEAFERHVAACDSCAVELVLARRTGVGAQPASRTWAWRIAASLAVVLGGLVAALLAARAVSGRIEERMASALRDAMGGKASVGDVTLALRGGPGVDVTGLSIADPTGGPAMVQVPSARRTVDLASLARGEISGSLVLRDPTIHIVRDPEGRLNVDGVLPTSRSSDDLFSRARRKAIDRVEVANGTVSLVDRASGDPREVRMAAVDAQLAGLASRGPTHVVARGGLESTRRNASFEGDIGPWGEGQKPAYRFSRVALDGVALRNLPVGRTVRGGLSFDGSLAGAG
ncbi:MAG: zf-HC2 domain-containing protein, partial [Alphaproteobacteria bacterium]